MINEVKTTEEKLLTKLKTPIAGSKNTSFSVALIKQMLFSMWGNNNEKEETIAIKSCFDIMESLEPKDEIEGMAMAQMIGLHNASMECMRRAMIDGQPFVNRDSNLKHAAKLSNTYATLLGALQKHRGKGQQKMTVEHVHVHEGGQAIVGCVEGKG